MLGVVFLDSPGLFPPLYRTGDMMSINRNRVHLFLLVVVLQVIIVEGKKGGKGKGKDKEGDDGSGNGGTIGIIAGIVAGTSLPNPKNLSADKTVFRRRRPHRFRGGEIPLVD